MSLAMYAAPFDTDENDDYSSSNNRRNLHQGHRSSSLPSQRSSPSPTPPPSHRPRPRPPQKNKNIDLSSSSSSSSSPSSGMLPRSSPSPYNGTPSLSSSTHTHTSHPHSEKVMSVLQTMQHLHNSPHEEDDSYSDDFVPLAPPTSVGVQNKIDKERNSPHLKEGFTPSNFQNVSHYSVFENDYDENEGPIYGNTLLPSSHHNDLNHPNNWEHEKYKQMVPNYEEMYNNYYKQNTHEIPTATPTSSSSFSSNTNNDVLLNKLNYMIHLLEENHDERTNNVTEEVILYSFLGVFVIFIVDSFTRVGKYTR